MRRSAAAVLRRSLTAMLKTVTAVRAAPEIPAVKKKRLSVSAGCWNASNAY